MRKAVATILLLTSVGLNWPASALLSTSHVADNQHSDSLPSDCCQFQLAQIAGESARIETSAGGMLLARGGLCVDWRPTERTGFPPRPKNSQTLQSQHVLLRI